MITIVGSLEDGYQHTMEHLAWRQVKGAFDVKMKLVPIDYPTMEEVIASLTGRKVFLIPPNRMDSIDFKMYKPPKGDVNYIFGKPRVNLVRYVTERDDVISIHTPNNVDMMAISVVGIVLNEYRQ